MDLAPRHPLARLLEEIYKILTDKVFREHHERKKQHEQQTQHEKSRNAKLHGEKKNARNNMNTGRFNERNEKTTTRNK